MDGADVVLEPGDLWYPPAGHSAARSDAAVKPLRRCVQWLWLCQTGCQGILEMSGVGQDRDVRFSWVLGSFKDDLRWGNNARDGRPQVGIFLTSGGTSGSRRHGR